MTRTQKRQAASSAMDNAKGLLDEYGRWWLQKKEAEDHLKRLRPEINEVLHNSGSVVHNNLQFNLTQTAGRKTYDTKAAIADGIDLEPYLKVGSPSFTLTIKEVNVL